MLKTEFGSVNSTVPLPVLVEPMVIDEGVETFPPLATVKLPRPFKTLVTTSSKSIGTRL